MKKTLKLVIIFMAVMIVGVVGALGGYLLISKNKTFYIYNVRLVHPIKEATSYVYTVKVDEPYRSIKNVTPYMTNEESNQMEIAVYVETSNKSRDVEITSSNPDVAKVIFKNNKCFVKYLKAGKATITASLGGVEDSFDVTVYDQVAAEFCVYDYKYYGEYAKLLPNDIIGYSDGIAYAYDYEGYSAAGDEAGDALDDDLLKVDMTNIEPGIFAEGYPKIDAKNKKLLVKCKENLKEERVVPIPVQSYIYDEVGQIVPHGDPYIVNVDIVTYVPEFLQVVLATTPNFKDAAVFMSTKIVSDDDLTESIIKEDKTILDNYLSYKKAENNLVPHGETAVYETFFTEKVSKIYLKFRKVYTNGDIVYLNELETSEYFDIDLNEDSDWDYLKIEPTKDFYRLTLTEEYFETYGTFDITVSLTDYDKTETFKFDFASLTNANKDLFYTHNAETSSYVYTYWDNRTRYDNEDYDVNGKIIGFFS